MKEKLFKATKAFQDIIRWGIKNEQDLPGENGEIFPYDTIVFDTTEEGKLQLSLFFDGEKIADSRNYDFNLGNRLKIEGIHGFVDIQFFKEIEEHPLPEIFETIDSVPSCSCYECKAACVHKPGWFIPQQLYSLFVKFNVDTVQGLLDTGYFAIDWYENYGGEDILVLAPNIRGNNSIQYPSNPKGTCVFLNENEGCDIYEVRPIECKALHHTEAWNQSCFEMHKKVAFEWEDGKYLLARFKDQIEIKPYECSLMDMFFGL